METWVGQVEVQSISGHSRPQDQAEQEVGEVGEGGRGGRRIYDVFRRGVQSVCEDGAT